MPRAMPRIDANIGQDSEPSRSMRFHLRYLGYAREGSSRIIEMHPEGTVLGANAIPQRIRMRMQLDRTGLLSFHLSLAVRREPISGHSPARLVEGGYTYSAADAHAVYPSADRSAVSRVWMRVGTSGSRSVRPMHDCGATRPRAPGTVNASSAHHRLSRRRRGCEQQQGQS